MTNMAALELKRHLGVDYDQQKSPRDKAAWRIKHKVMQAMVEREAPHQLSGFVQIDDAYLGGERNGGKPGRGSENKQAFLVAVQTDAVLEHPTYAVIEPVRSFDDASIQDWQARHLAPIAEVFSDGLFCFRCFGRRPQEVPFRDAGHAHTVLETGGGRAACEVNGARWVNVLLKLPCHPAGQVRTPKRRHPGVPGDCGSCASWIRSSQIASKPATLKTPL